MYTHRAFLRASWEIEGVDQEVRLGFEVTLQSTITLFGGKYHEDSFEMKDNESNVTSFSQS